MKKLSIVLLAMSLVIGVACAADVITDMVAYWPLDGNADDAFGENDGKTVGGVKWVQGRVGKAGDFDGTCSINVPDFSLITNDITFAAWIKGWKVEAWAGIVGTRTPTACEMIFGDNDTLHYVWNDNAANTYSWAGAPVIPQNEWALVALTVDPDKATAYVYDDAKGLKSSSNDIPHIEQNLGNINIAWVDCCGNTRYYKGIIDEVLIYKRALSEDDMLQLATKGLAVNPTNNLATAWGKVKDK